MCKAMCGVAAGACNGSINVHWSRGSDISDINAKFGAQHTVTGSLGLLFAAAFAKSVSNVSSHILWMLYTTMTVVHIFANMMCMKLVAFDYFNAERMTDVVESFLDRVRDGEDPSKILVEAPIGVSFQEALFFRSSRRMPIKMGVSFDYLATQSKMNDSVITQAARDISNVKYAVLLGHKSILIAVSDGSTPSDKAKGYFHALILRKLVEYDNSIQNGVALKNASVEVVNRLWPHFKSSARKAQWNLDKTELNTQGYEVDVSEKRQS